MWNFSLLACPEPVRFDCDAPSQPDVRLAPLHPNDPPLLALGVDTL